jgi:hypothetical protein
MKTHQIQLEGKGYATRENAVKAVEKAFGPHHGHFGSADVRYLIAVTAEGRFLPVFIGQSAVENTVHTKFHVAA